MIVLEQAAAVPFEAMAVDLQPRAAFLASASTVYDLLSIGTGMLAKGPEEMEALGGEVEAS